MPFIGRVARYTPSSSPKIASKIKANLEFHKSSDDFNKRYVSNANALYTTLSNVQKITSAENLRSRAFDDELNINCNRKIAEVIF